MTKLELYPFFDISGANFSPSKVAELTGIKLSNVVERGDIGKRGAHRGKPAPYGSARVSIDSERITDADVEGMVAMFGKHIAAIRECGADRIVFWLVIAYEGDDCSVSYSPSFLRQIADVGIPWCITVYPKEESDKASAK
jgi:hypothetical protein